ncbi:hypothetical protein [Christiangramia flava]|uniref:hypothetical protein n=1 Tax=Christiangramia flava TaxID=1486245 RepID=UPI00111C0CE4|nr:hypothetical protein [Christiangramia flava]
MQNTGFEMVLASNLVSGQNFEWNTNFNFSIPKNELLRYPGLQESTYANKYVVGEPLNIELLYQYTGLDPETGFYSVLDRNDDGSLDYEDRKIALDKSPSFFGGWNHELNFKNFSLQFLWRFVKQEGTLELFKAGFLQNQRAEVIDALNTNTQYQLVSRSTAASRAYNNVLNSNYTITDASFLRLQNLNLSYDVPKNWLRPLGMKSATLFFTGQNLITLTSYKGLDPEIPNGGINFNSLRSITTGLNLKF